MSLVYDPTDGALVAFEYGPCIGVLSAGADCDMRTYTCVLSGLLGNMAAANGTHVLVGVTTDWVLDIGAYIITLFRYEYSDIDWRIQVKATGFRGAVGYSADSAYNSTCCPPNVIYPYVYGTAQATPSPGSTATLS